jgi:hypothetical protein
MGSHTQNEEGTLVQCSTAQRKCSTSMAMASGAAGANGHKQPDNMPGNIDTQKLSAPKIHRHCVHWATCAVWGAPLKLAEILADIMEYQIMLCV